MVTSRTKALVGFIAFLALLQIIFEDLMVFLGSTGRIPDGTLNSPYVMIAIPLTISLTLILVLVGSAFLYSD
ncbi:MAG: hypothetical protein ABEI52_02505 [Halobacteriaceae archaeon]